DRHVFDHAAAQSAHCLVGHGDASVSSELVAALNLKPGRSPRAIVLALSLAAAPFRASGLVPWPATAKTQHRGIGGSLRQSRRQLDKVSATVLSRRRHLAFGYSAEKRVLMTARQGSPHVSPGGRPTRIVNRVHQRLDPQARAEIEGFRPTPGDRLEITR